MLLLYCTKPCKTRASIGSTDRESLADRVHSQEMLRPPETEDVPQDLANRYGGGIP